MEDMYDGLSENQGLETDRNVPKVIKGNLRTYFLDVHATPQKDAYVTITESKKCYDSYGHYFYERHKVFLFKEDMRNMIDALKEVVDYMESADFDINKLPKRENGSFEKKKPPVFIKKLPKKVSDESPEILTEDPVDSYLNIEFEDLAVTS